MHRINSGGSAIFLCIKTFFLNSVPTPLNRIKSLEKTQNCKILLYKNCAKMIIQKTDKLAPVRPKRDLNGVPRNPGRLRCDAKISAGFRTIDRYTSDEIGGEVVW